MMTRESWFKLRTWQESLGEHARKVILLAFVTSLIALVYVCLAPDVQAVIDAIYLWTIPAYFVVLVLLFGAITMPFAFHPITRVIWAVAVWLFLSYLVANLGVFNLYGFHIDLVLLKMFFFDFKGMGFPTPLLILFSFVFLSLGALVLFGSQISNSSFRRRFQLNRIGVLFVSLSIPSFVINQGIHAWGQHYHQSSITQYTPVFPLYYPIESGHSIEQLTKVYPSLVPAVIGEAGFELAKSARAQGRLYFPKAAFNCDSGIKQNIVLIVLESWQAKSFRPDSMPHLTSLLKEATFFSRHISSGTATVPGFFGLFYGLHPSYYESVRSQAERYPAPLTELAIDLGYTLRVFSSGDLERFSLRKMFFSKVGDDQFSYFKADENLMERYIELIHHKSSNPTFDMLYLTSSHSPYLYPKSKAPFLPLPAVEGAYVFDKAMDPIPFRNDYLNSLHYLDSLIGRLIESLKAAGRYEETWIVVTGDHGEEFNESKLGLWGHGSSFSQWQTATPLVLRAPGQRDRGVVTKPTFHQDVAPTLIHEVFGCKNPESDFSNGYNLRDSPASRHAVINSYVTQAYWIDGYVWERNTGRHYSWEDPSVSNQPVPPSDRLRQLLAEESFFLKP